MIRAMIDRQTDIGLVRNALRRSRVVALLGPRQCGKTTLARQFVPADSLNYFDLEDPQSLGRLAEPNTALRPLKGLVVIDEIQRRPELFPLLRVLADRKPLPARFLVLGVHRPNSSANPPRPWRGAWKRCFWKAFAWRPGPEVQGRLWLRGGFPLAYTAKSETDSVACAGSSSRRFWNATFRNWGSRFQLLPSGGFGTCWPTITPKPGTAPSSPVCSP